MGAQQKNWIGRSTGADVNFNTTEGDVLTVYTTRCDTLFGATYMVIAPEHAYVEKWKDKLSNYDEVAEYVRVAATKSDFERTELVKEKTGVELKGVRAINPVNNQEIPIFISDYVLASYGTGAIMAVPAHDTRDWEFAKAFGLPMVQVVAGPEGEVDISKGAFTDVETGVSVNSGFLTGLSVEDAKAKMNGGKPITSAAPRSTTSSATGFSPVSVIGASPSPSSSAKSAAMWLCPKTSCPCCCRKWRATRPPTTGNPPCPP